MLRSQQSRGGLELLQHFAAPFMHTAFSIGKLMFATSRLLMRDGDPKHRTKGPYAR